MADKSDLQIAIGDAQALAPSDRALIENTYNSSLAVYQNNFLPQMDIDRADAALRNALLRLTPINISLSAAPFCGIEADVEFFLSVEKAWNLLAVEVTIEIDASLLSGKGVSAYLGFDQITDIAWKSAGGNLWRGTVTLGRKSGGAAGLSTDSPVDIAKFIFAPKDKGLTAMKLLNARAYGLDENNKEVMEIPVAITVGEAYTNIDQLIYSKYDLNKDNKVDALDLGIMLLYCGFKASDPEWGNLVKVVDSKGEPVTASQCDINADGFVDMLDLIDLFINYTKKAT